MPYRVIDHTADSGIHVLGADYRELFAEAAHAMLDQIVDRRTLRASARQTLRVDGDNPADLMINWLREVLFLWDGRQVLVKRVRILSASRVALTAELTGDPYDPARHKIRDEIKAVTYHQLEVNSTPHGWEARIIFDV